MRKRRFVARLLIAVIGFLLLWYGVVRVTSGDRRLRLSGSGEFSGDWQGTIRIGCYNLAHGRGEAPGGSNWEGGTKEERWKRLDEIAKLIKARNLDLLVLNEVDFDCTWSHGVDQAAVLAEKCGYSHVAEQRNLDLGLPFFRVAIGNAVLSRFPIREIEEVDYPAVNGWEPLVVGKKRGLMTLLQLPDGSELEVFGVHAETRNKEVRKASVQQLINQAGERAILAGDFNSARGGPGSSAIDLILADGRWKAGTNKNPTFPTLNPAKRIDWILVPTQWPEISSDTVISTLSDHALVVGEWRVSDERHRPEPTQ